MAKATKAPNYSDADVAALASGYTGENNAVEVAALSAALGKSPASVRAKLASMGLFQKAEVAKKAGGVTKQAVADRIAKHVGLNDTDAEALGKTTRRVLDAIHAKFAIESDA